MFDNLWKLIIEKKWDEVKTAVMSSTLDPRELNTHFWEKALAEQNIKLIQVTCRNERDIALGADPKIIFATSLIDMVK